MNVRIKIAAILFVFTVALTGFGPLAKQADAASTIASTGKPGLAYVTQVNGTIINYYNKLYDAGTIVYRSSSSTGIQKVLTYYEIYRLNINNNTWVKMTTTKAVSKNIPAGVNSIRLAPLSVLPNHNAASKYYVLQKIQWSSGSGIVLGTKTIKFDLSTDYKCTNLPSTRCQVYNGYIYLKP